MTDRTWEKYVSPRKRMAMGDKDPLKVGNYDCTSLAAANKDMPSGKGNGYLKDDERAARSPIEGNQANAQHGE